MTNHDRDTTPGTATGYAPVSAPLVLDLFAGHGVDVGARALGLDPIGIELDADTCATRALHGMRTIRADVSTFPLDQFDGKQVDGIWASPPCQDWSSAGNREGREGSSGWLVDQPLRWVEELRPRWVALEQVPPALPVWKAHARTFEGLGYSTWTGVLNSADYGVPQTRKRAILMASLDKAASPPPATHAKDPQPSLFDGEHERWVSMADALGWPAECPRPPRSWSGPSPTGSTSRWKLHVVPASWCWERPATTVCGDPRIGRPGHKDRSAGGESQFAKDSVRVSVGDALVLQSYPREFALAGTKSSQFQQIGNAVPPLLAQRILEVLL